MAESPAFRSRSANLRVSKVPGGNIYPIKEQKNLSGTNYSGKRWRENRGPLLPSGRTNEKRPPEGGRFNFRST